MKNKEIRRVINRTFFIKNNDRDLSLQLKIRNQLKTLYSKSNYCLFQTMKEGSFNLNEPATGKEHIKVPVLEDMWSN